MTGNPEFGPLGPPVLVDAHVHYHDCFAPGPFLDAAARNVRSATARLELPETTIGVLVMTQGTAEGSFERVRRWAEGESEWRLLPTAENVSTLAVRGGRVHLVLAAGRQLRTAERLEVLALGRTEILAEGRPIGEVLEAVRTAGALPVVPWGFGKWWLGRGRHLGRMLEGQDPTQFFLGDNGGRPGAFQRPALFAAAERRGIRDLPGSDPLPLPWEVGRAGSRGFLLDRALNPDRPVADLLSLLRDPALRPSGYGAGSALVPFLRNQTALRLGRGRTRRKR